METRDPFTGTALGSRTRRRSLAIVFFALAAMTAAFAVRYGSLGAWPLAALLATLFNGGLLVAVAAVAVRATGRRWPWLPIGVGGAAVATASGSVAARLLGVFQ